MNQRLFLKAGILVLVLLSFSFPVESLTTYLKHPGRSKLMEVVRHQTRVKIVESNNVTLRPGSVYDNITLFELYRGWKPEFIYQFIDTGLGAAEPLYPNLQVGHQASWLQLLPAFGDETARHIDHFTSITTPEGCKVDSAYLLRHMKEFSDDIFKEERKEGFDLVVVRFEHYTRLTPDTVCGRHHANDPDPKFKPMKVMEKWAKKKKLYSLTQLDPDVLKRFEAKVSVIYHISEERDKKKWDPIDITDEAENSLWYYPDGHDKDYGLNHKYAIAGMNWLNSPDQLVVAASDIVQQNLGLNQLVSKVNFQKLIDFMNGLPTKGFDPQTEPGKDTLYLSDVTSKNYYTAGLEMIPINNVFNDVEDMSNYGLVGMTVKPSEKLEVNGDVKTIPQIRFVYQLLNPNKKEEALEQLYFHIKYNIVDPTSSDKDIELKNQEFMQEFDHLVGREQKSDPNYDQALIDFIRKYTFQGIDSLTFSSSLTGIWVFGELADNGGVLEAKKVVRDGVDYGYYSSAYDNDLLREAIKQSSGAYKERLEEQLDSLIVTTYRDPKRMDTHKINFNSVSCAQCHQLSGRDGVHMAFNDGIDLRIPFPVRASEYLIRESADHLQAAENNY